jgi:hypothetical protein
MSLITISKECIGIRDPTPREDSVVKIWDKDGVIT